MPKRSTISLLGVLAIAPGLSGCFQHQLVQTFNAGGKTIAGPGSYAGKNNGDEQVLYLIAPMQSPAASSSNSSLLEVTIVNRGNCSVQLQIWHRDDNATFVVDNEIPVPPGQTACIHGRGHKVTAKGVQPGGPRCEYWWRIDTGYH